MKSRNNNKQNSNNISKYAILKEKKYSRLTLDIIYYLYWIIAISVKVFYFQFTTRISIKPFNQPINNNMLLSNLGLSLIILGIILFVAYRCRKRTLFIINIIIGSLLLADTLYFRYFYTPLNVTIFYQFSFFGDVKTSIGTLFKPKDIVYLIDIPFHLIFATFIGKFKYVKFKRRIRYCFGIVIIIMGFLIFNNIYKQSNTEMYQYDRNNVAKDLGILYYHYYDVSNFISEEIKKHKKMTPQEKVLVENYFKDKETSGKLYNGIGKGKNLIIVQLEAIQQFVIGNTIDGRELTPTLNKLIDESIYFKNFYYQVAAGNTSDAEFLTNNSLYPAQSGAVYYRYTYNKYFSLPNIMKDLGYNTYALHGYKPSFWNRSNMYKTLGFNKFISYNDYVLDDIVGWAISDYSFFKQSLDKMDTSNPFYSFFITLSSHHPYDAFKNEQFDAGKYEGTQLGNYMKAVHYVDWCIKNFIEDLKARDLYDNSIIVFYGDHSAIFKDQIADMSTYLNIAFDDYKWKKIQQVPCFIHIPELKEGVEISTTGGQIDILPTIANIMGFDIPYAMGKDLLNTENGYAVLRDSTVITDEYMFLSQQNKLYDLATDKELDYEKYKDEIKKYQEQLFISDTILEKNYFNNLNGKR